MINGLILSKDRASQLRFLLESIHYNMPSFFNEIRVIHTSSTEDFAKGYEKLKSEEILPNIVWQEEVDFVEDFLGYLNSCESEYICGIVDDCVIYKRVSTNPEFVESMITDDVFCFSMRLGLNTTVQNYLDPDRHGEVKLKKYDFNPVVIKWNWKEWDSTMNFGYPISLDGHIFRTKELAELSNSHKFDYLRQWEGVIAGKSRKEVDRPSMASYHQSILFSIPCNCVQDPPLISGQMFYHSEEELNEKYLNDEVISWDKMQYAFQNVNWSHNEIKILFEEM